MEKPAPLTEPADGCNHLICMFSHELINKLSVIVGHCDLLQDPGQSEEKRAQHLTRIRAAAVSMAETFQHQQCEVAVREQRAPVRLRTIVS